MGMKEFNCFSGNQLPPLQDAVNVSTHGRQHIAVGNVARCSEVFFHLAAADEEYIVPAPFVQFLQVLCFAFLCLRLNNETLALPHSRRQRNASTSPLS
eukprot:00722_6